MPIREYDPRPIHEKLAFNQPLHGDMITYLGNRRRESDDAMSDRYNSWDMVDDHWQLKLDLNDPIERIDGTADYSAEWPFEFGVVIPATYAGLIVRLMQEMATFTQRDPMIELTGTGPEDVQAALIMEAALAHDLRSSQFLIVLWSLFQDAERYGIGVLRDCWNEEYGTKILKPMIDPDMVRQKFGPRVASFLAQRFPKLVEPRMIEDAIIREHVLFRTVDPRWFYRDPNWSCLDLQRGAFCGHREPSSFADLEMESIERVGPDEGDYFNLKRVKDLMRGRPTKKEKRRDGRAPGEKGADLARDEYYVAPVDVDKLECRVVPYELGLAEKDTPQIWVFEMVDDNVIIAAYPKPNWHQRYSYSVGEVQPDPHVFSNPGYAEHVRGLQNYINWMVNADYTYTMKRINNSLMYFPELIDSDDLYSSNIAGHIKGTPEFLQLIMQGRMSWSDAVSQLEMPDSTGHYLEKAMWMMEQMQREFGSSDPMSGMPLPTRRTLGEVNLVTQMASQRIIQVVQLVDEMAIEPAIMRAVADRQQFTSFDKYMRISGDLVHQLGGAERVLVKRYDLYGDFDYIKVDATSPVDPSRTAETVMQFFQVLAQAGPEAMAMFNLPMLFGEMARTMGFRHWDRFLVQPPPPPTVVEDEEVATMSARGQLAPVPDEMTVGA